MTCPSNEELEHWLQAVHGDDKIADHFNGCPACQDRAQLIARSLEPLLAEIPLLFQKPSASAHGSQAAKSEKADPSQSISVVRLNDLGDADARPVFARHRLLGTLGIGGMGVVCLAEHIELGTLRAIKFLTSDYGENSEAILRFQREWRSISQIEHPNLARAIDCGEESGVQFLVMDHIDGQTLGDLIGQFGPLSDNVVASIGVQAASGLAILHARGFVHRDIKPSNILLGCDGVVRIIDFGLACLHGEFSQDDLLTGTHQLVGSPACMAPEQFQSGPSADAGSDLYALGCTLFTLLTGESPYPTANKTIWQIATEHASPHVPDVRDRRADVGADLALLIQELMQPVPGERPVNAAAVAKKIARLGDDRALVDFAADLETPPPARIPDALLTRIQEASVSSHTGDLPGVTEPTIAVNRPDSKRSPRSTTWTRIAVAGVLRVDRRNCGPIEFAGFAGRIRLTQRTPSSESG